MKGKKCLYWLLSIVLVFSAYLGTFSPVSAFEIGEGSALVLIDGHIETSNGRVNATISGSDLVFPIPSTDTSVNGLYFDFNTSSGLTPDFMFTFNVRYQATNSVNGYLQLDGLLGQNMDIITLDCVDARNNAVYDGSVLYYQGSQTVTCSYLAISHGNYSNFESRLNSRIALFYQQVPQSSKIIVTPGFVRHFTTNGLTEDDRDWLESVLETSSTDVSAVVNSINNLRTDTQEQTEAIEEQTEVISDMNDFLQDDSEPEVDSSALADSAGWLPAGPVDSILTLPLTFIQALLNVFQTDNCQPVILPLPYLNGQTLPLPCMRPILNQMGFLSIYEVVGSVISMFVIWDTLKWLYKWVDDTLQFRENNQFGGF